MANTTVYPYGTNGELPSSIGLVNDLITGGVDKALTAEQGKVLNDYIFGGHETTIALSEYTRNSYFINVSTLKWQASSIHYVGKCLIIPIGDATSIKVTMSGGTGWASLLSSDSVTINTSPSFASGQSGVDEIGDGSYKEYSGFTDAEFLYIYCNSSSGADILGRYSVVFGYYSQRYVALYDEVFGEKEQQTYTKADATQYYVDLQGNEVSSNPLRIRVVIPVFVGDIVIASCSLGKGVAASVYNSVVNAKKAETNYLQTLSYSYVSSVEGEISANGYLTVSLCKSDSSAFTSQEIEDFMDALNMSVVRMVGEDGLKKQLEDEIAQLVNNVSVYQDVFIGTLVQKKMTSGGLSDADDNYRVSMASCIVVPRESAKLTFTLPEEYEIGIRSGNEADNLSNNNYWYTNGQSFTFANGVHYYRLCFAKLPDPATTEITVSEINSHIEDGSIRITISYEDDIIKRNMENEKYVKAIMRNFVSGASNNGSLTKLPVFAHTSDVHGDANRFMSYMDYCDYLKLDAMLVTGDTVASTPANSMQYINDIADKHTTPVLICTGNHDCVGLSTKQSQNEQIMGYLITKNGSTTAQGETYPTYYYQDFSSKSIRVISLNLYETNHTSHSCNFSQDQCEWLISVLASTPANYGVMILFHAPEGRPVKDNNYATFYQDLLNWSTYYQDALTGNVFRKIIDAFIGKTTASITYTSKSTSITVSADFTGVASGVEFIAYLSGHMHADLVGYTEGSTYKQLNLNVPCGVAIYGSTYYYLANNSEVPRGCSGSTQDCFNIYAIDRTAKTVRIARVGSNITGRLTERKYMEIPYAD